MNPSVSCLGHGALSQPQKGDEDTGSGHLQSCPHSLGSPHDHSISLDTLCVSEQKRGAQLISVLERAWHLVAFKVPP